MGSKILAKQKFEKALKKEGYSISEPYSGYNYRHDALCPIGHKIKIDANNFIGRGARCPLCYNEKTSERCKTPFKKIKELVKKKGFTLITTKEEYETNHHKDLKIITQCKCGEIVSRTLEGLKRVTKCRACYLIDEKEAHNSLDFKSVKEKLENIGYKMISTEYLGSKTPITVQCPKGHEPWKTIWNSIDQGQRCPKCSKSASKPQIEMMNFVKSIYTGTVIDRDRKTLRGLELDIWLPELRIGIEHDGLYHHSSYLRNDHSKKNIEKRKRASEAGITFLAFYGDEWQNKQDLVKSIIKSKIGVIKNKIYARNTKFTEITNQEAKIFLEANHLEGYVKCTRAFGLKHNDKLVMCVTFRKTMKNQHELARMATLIDHVVVGGASKLLKHAPKPLISYSNNRISSGEVYGGLGFEEITETTQPSYFYTDFRKRVFRTQCQKIKDLPGTEEEQALAGAFSQKRFGHNKPLYRIYDYGHRKWLKID